MDNRMAKIRQGDRYPTWFSGRKDGLSEILGIRPYTGPYKFLDYIVRLSAPKTMRGWMEMTIQKSDLSKVVPRPTSRD